MKEYTTQYRNNTTILHNIKHKIMTQTEKELLLRDLCARLPYDVKVFYDNKVYSIDYVSCTYEEIKLDILDNYTIGISEVKPYLFPLSSMTEEQYNEFFSYYHNIEMAEIKSSGDYLKAAYISDDAKYSWLNKNHFDYRGLIERGLAIDATGLNIY